MKQGLLWLGTALVRCNVLITSLNDGLENKFMELEGGKRERICKEESSGRCG